MNRLKWWVLVNWWSISLRMHKLTWPKASFQEIHSYLAAESKYLVSWDKGKEVEGAKELLLNILFIWTSQMMHIIGLANPVDWADQSWPTTSRLTAAQLYFLSAHWTERTLWSSCLIFIAILWQYKVHCCFLFIEHIFHFSPLFSSTLVFTGFVKISFLLPQEILFCRINANSPPKISTGYVPKLKHMKLYRSKERTEILLDNFESIYLLPPHFSYFSFFVCFQLNHSLNRFLHMLCIYETFFILVNGAESKDCLANRSLNRLQFASSLL